ncbi:MAG: phosphatase PAP2 family protein [Ruminococcaceae bacterium]|nr:phosphatase PAP2 family protein [Oscillospiraceae bacterium]
MDWEFAVLDFISETFSCKPMDVIMKAITFLGEAGWLWIALGVAFLFFKKTRKMGATVLGALIFSLLLCNITLKPIVARIRPYDIKEGIDLIIGKPSDFSFPSGHTSASFAAAVAIFACNKKWGIWAVVLAAIIAFTRLYLYVHFPTDVLAGMLLGTLCAVISYYIVKFIWQKTVKKEV